MAPLLVAVTGSTTPSAVAGFPKASVALNVTNRYAFRDLSHLSWVWELTSDRSEKPIRSTSFQLADKDGSEGLILKLDSAITRVQELEVTRPERGNQYFLNIRGFLQQDETWAEKNTCLVTQQFPIKFVFEELVQRNLERPLERKASFQLEVSEDVSTVQVFRGGDGATEPLVVFDKHSGGITSFSPQGANLLTEPVLPNFTRASTDNDQGGIEMAISQFLGIDGLSHIVGVLWGYEDYSYDSHWRTTGLHQSKPPEIICRRLSVLEHKLEGTVDVVALCRAVQAKNGKELFNVTITYTVCSDGRVRISSHLEPHSILRHIPSVPRVGMHLQLARSLFNIQYFGRGPDENYPDRKSGCKMGVFATTPVDMAYDGYIVPGENGSRSDCEWITFRSGDGSGVSIVSDTDSGKNSTFSCSALLHSAGELHTATHTCDLARRANGSDPIHVNVDHQLMGVGGDNSWFPVVYPEFLVKATDDFHYSLWLVPLKKDDDAAVSARHIDATESSY